MVNDELTKRYEDAINSFVDKIRDDPNVIAVLVYGSASHDAVWEKSDIDMNVIVRDQKLDRKSFGIYEDDILINVDLWQRSDFKRGMERNLTGSIGHSFGSTSKIVYTTDDSLYDYLEEYKRVGKSDMERSLFFMASGLVGAMQKVEKWIKVKKDLDYARLYLLFGANNIAQMEVCRNFDVPTREAILQAAKINPALMEKFYYRPLSGHMSEEEIYALLGEMDKYLMENIESILNAAAECLGDGEIKTGTQISNYYKTSIHFIDGILDYLCEKRYLERLSQTIRITPKSKLNVEEIAFFMPQF